MYYPFQYHCLLSINVFTGNTIDYEDAISENSLTASNQGLTLSALKNASTTVPTDKPIQDNAQCKVTNKIINLGNRNVSIGK